MKDSTITKIVREIKSLFTIILIALSLRATIIEAYIVPTGSMENTIMTGDFLIGNKFVYGMRTPDWMLTFLMPGISRAFRIRSIVGPWSVPRSLQTVG